MTSATTAPEQLRRPPSNLSGALAWAAQSELLKIAAVVLIFVWIPLFTIKAPVVDPDIWWHMRTGEWIMQHHQIPRTDPFSITGAGKPWVAYSWSFEVLAYWVGKYWDLAGLAALRILMWLAATAAFFNLLRKAAPQFWRAVALTLLGSYVMVRVFSPRPGALTVLFFLLEFTILWEADRTGRTGKLWLLPPLLCLWANVHAQFVYGLLLVGLFCIEPVLNRFFYHCCGERIRNRVLWLVLAASAAATLINPYGWGVYRVVLDYGHQVWSTRYIVELEALPFNQPSDYLAVFLALAAAFALGRDDRLRPAWVLLLAWAAISAFRAQRDIWLLTIVSCVIIGARLSPRSSEIVPLGRRARLAAIACVLAILSIGWFRFGPTNKQLLSQLALRLPLGSVAYIREHHLRGPVFNNFDWGGFLIYALPEEKVAIDGRTNVHSAVELQRSFAAWSGAPGWRNDPLLANANLVIAGPAFSLTQLLRSDPRFQPVFDDGVSVVFQKVGPDAGRGSTKHADER